MTDPKQIAETVARLREEGTTLHGIAIDRGSVDASLSGLLADEAADLLQSLAAENAALKADIDTYQGIVRDMTAEAEADAARLAEVEAERDALETAREMLGGFWAKDNARAEAAEAERDRLAAELAALTKGTPA